MVERIGQQVGEYLLHLNGIEWDIIIGIIHLEREVKLSFLDHIGKHGDNLANEVINMPYRVVDNHLTALQRAEIQQLGDEPGQFAAVSLKNIQRHSCALRHLLIGNQIVDGTAD